MFYVEQNNKIIFSDNSRQRIVDTFLFFPELSEKDIKETKRAIENNLFVGSIEHTVWKAEQIRFERNAKLQATDKYMLSDFDISEEKRNAYRIYRQALRDISIQEGFPHNAVFPTEP